jgi:hypothetical protein
VEAKEMGLQIGVEVKQVGPQIAEPKVAMEGSMQRVE